MKKKFKETFATYTKALVAIVIGVCLIDVQITYVLAFLGKENTLEDLSRQLVTTIIGTAVVYMVRAYFDTKAEHAEKNELEEKRRQEELLNQQNDTNNIEK